LVGLLDGVLSEHCLHDPVPQRTVYCRSTSFNSLVANQLSECLPLGPDEVDDMVMFSTSYSMHGSSALLKFSLHICSEIFAAAAVVTTAKLPPS
jgi:hypothetical protein